MNATHRLVPLLLLCACVTQHARSLNLTTDFERFGLSPTVVAQWEDGRRADDAPGSFEWWYFDAHLEDGSTLVVVFYDKPITDVSGPVHPTVAVDLTRPDGTKVADSWSLAGPLDSSKERCDVRIGESRFSGDLHEYRITAKTGAISVDVVLDGVVPAWRPAAGAIGFGDHAFWWLPAVPQGQVRGTVTTKDGVMKVVGVGYHDHNWGNAPLTDMMHDWYWGRAQVGEYTVISSFITAHERYGKAQFPIFLLAKGKELLATDGRKVQFTSGLTAVDDDTGKPWSPHLVWDSVDGDKHYRVTFSHRRTLLKSRLAADLTGISKLAARLAEVDPAYLRFTGDVTVEELEGEKVVKSTTNHAAVWELMYLGQPR